MKGIYLVGRSRACQIRPKNKSVSRKHCAIIHRGKRLYVQDIGSKTGTFVNGERIAAQHPVTLTDGDELRVGRTLFSICIESVVKKSKQHLVASAAGQLQSTDAGFHSVALPAVVSEPELDQHDDDDQPHADPTEDILKLLEDDDEPQATVSGPSFSLGTHGHANADVDLEDSDSGVEFLAPESGESLSEQDAVPAYQLRHDWDVQGVHRWVASKPETAKPTPAFQPKAQPEKAKQPFRVKPDSELSWLQSDSLQPVGMGLGITVFVLWMAWNVWQLWSFQG